MVCPLPSVLRQVGMCCYSWDVRHQLNIVLHYAYIRCLYMHQMLGILRCAEVFSLTRCKVCEQPLCSTKSRASTTSFWDRFGFGNHLAHVRVIEIALDQNDRTIGEKDSGIQSLRGVGHSFYFYGMSSRLFECVFELYGSLSWLAVAGRRTLCQGLAFADKSGTSSPTLERWRAWLGWAGSKPRTLNRVQATAGGSITLPTSSIISTGQKRDEFIKKDWERDEAEIVNA